MYVMKSSSSYKIYFQGNLNYGKAFYIALIVFHYCTLYVKGFINCVTSAFCEWQNGDTSDTVTFIYVTD